ncbi:MAG TPA: hypothetical protein DDZ51_21510 [Planctomycetaceae bacterium]|nr:hypothetical protein [Planctomycetaceae bacterium]
MPTPRRAYKRKRKLNDFRTGAESVGIVIPLSLGCEFFDASAQGEIGTNRGAKFVGLVRIID